MIPSVKKSTKSFDMERQEINEVIGHVPGEHDALAAGTSSDVPAAAQATNGCVLDSGDAAEDNAGDGVSAAVVRGEAAVADGVPAAAGGGESISNNTLGGVGGADAGGAALHPTPPDCGSGAHVTFCW